MQQIFCSLRSLYRCNRQQISVTTIKEDLSSRVSDKQCDEQSQRSAVPFSKRMQHIQIIVKRCQLINKSIMIQSIQIILLFQSGKASISNLFYCFCTAKYCAFLGDCDCPNCSCPVDLQTKPYAVLCKMQSQHSQRLLLAQAVPRDRSPISAQPRKTVFDSEYQTD